MYKLLCTFTSLTLDSYQSSYATQNHQDKTLLVLIVPLKSRLFTRLHSEYPHGGHHCHR